MAVPTRKGRAGTAVTLSGTGESAGDQGAA